MPIEIGRKPQHFFDNPIGLLKDCHRRLERFLYILITILRQAQGGSLTDEQQGAMECALRYFNEAAPNHVQDEEMSLFPRMLECRNQQVERISARITKLEEEHQSVEQWHREVDELGKKWMLENKLMTGDRDRLSTLLGRLSNLYHHHIHIEETEIFPVAENVLEHSWVEVIGREMAERRKIDVDLRTAYHL